VTAATGSPRPTPSPAWGSPEYPAAGQALDEALSIFRDVGNRGNQIAALNERGAVHRLSGELASAQECHQQALALSRDMSSSSGEAHSLAGLGRCALAAGHAAQAEGLLRQALEILQRIGVADTQDLIDELESLAGRRPPQ
jgi:tetratricopeptide (TPR) repeat protein